MSPVVPGAVLADLQLLCLIFMKARQCRYYYPVLQVMKLKLAQKEVK